MPELWRDLTKAPISGCCRGCGGEVRIHFYSKYGREYVCMRCGATSPKPGRRVVVERREVVRGILDEVYERLEERGPVEFEPCMLVVAKVCMQKEKGWIPILSRKELKDWGYEEVVGIMRRVDGT